MHLHSHLDSCCEIFPVGSQESACCSWPSATPLRADPLCSNRGHPVKGSLLLCRLRPREGGDFLSSGQLQCLSLGMATPESSPLADLQAKTFPGRETPKTLLPGSPLEGCNAHFESLDKQKEVMVGMTLFPFLHSVGKLIPDT